ncbi:MAG: AAA family ATPase [Gemmatimonadota bacterium]|nr:MAG: AAA family ATPase [Gemmatimonadota bacterium]
MPRFHLHTLSRTPNLTVGERGDAKECLRFSKQLAVLIYLASRPQGRATREELIGLLWEGSSPHDARQALRQVVYQIRHGTDRELLSGDEVLVLERSALAFDVDAFRQLLAEGRLIEAFELYESDFLANVALSGAREFEQWAEGMRQQLAAEWRQLLRTLIAHAVDAGNWSDAAEYSRGLIERDPYDLEPRIKLVELLSLSGDEVRAQAAAEEFRRVAAEIHGERMPQVLEEALARAITPAAVPDRRQSRGFPRHPELVGRAGEFRSVVDRWRRALGGDGVAVLISGEAGIGKTRLTRDLVRRFQRDPCLVLQSACYTVEHSDPLGPFVEMLREAHAAPGLAAASPSSLEVLATFVPEVGTRFGATISARPAPIPREAMSVSLIDAFVAIAEELPLALIVEDLDRATPPTIEFVHRLARRAKGSHLLLLMTARDVGRVPETSQALRDLTSTGVVTEVPLTPLDLTDVWHFIGSIAKLPAEDTGWSLAERVVTKTAGVPFYVLELLKALYDSGDLAVEDGVWRFSEAVRDAARPLPMPETTAAILGKRLENLGETALEVFAALGVMERETSIKDLSALTGLEDDAVTGALGALQRRRLIGRKGGMPAVLHDELGAAAIHAVPAALVSRYHHRATELAEEAARLGRPAEWSVAAHHAASAGDFDRAALNAARAAALVERTSGREAAQETLHGILDPMPEPVRRELEGELATVLSGKRAARRWIELRTGRRPAWQHPAAVGGLAAAAVVIVVFAWLLSSDGGASPAVDQATIDGIEWCRGEFAVSPSPRGTRLACVSGDGLALSLGDAVSEAQPVTLEAPGRIQGAPVWSADGAYVGFWVEGDTNQLYLVERSGARGVRAVQGAEGMRMLLQGGRLD